MAGVSADAARTRCASQIFSNIVRGLPFAGFIVPTVAPAPIARPVTSATSSVKLNLTMDPALIPALHDALVVAQTGSVGEAARRLHKTASAVSQQLRRIEQRFGVALFERAGRGLRVSPAGETVLGSLTRLFEEASSLEGLLDGLATER